MASERQRAKAAITSRTQDEPGFEDIISDGQKFRLELNRETNRHKESMRASEIGKIGGFIGSDGNAAQAIALLVVLFGFLGLFGCLIAAYRSGDKDFWGRQAERSAAVAMTALSYIFGRGDRRPK